MMEHEEKAVPEYTRPEVKDYGTLRELTAAAATGGSTDVPKGTPLPNVFS
jgi:hypothetical protein